MPRKRARAKGASADGPSESTAAAVDLKRLLVPLQELGIDLTEPQLDELQRYVEILRVWARRIDLLSTRDLARIVDRHLFDSIAGAVPLSPLGPGARFADIGSGAGLPGIPLAIAMRARSVLLVEPRQRRASFLRSVAREIGRDRFLVETRRVEDLASDPMRPELDALVSRAALPVETLLRHAPMLLRPGGLLLAWRGPHQATASAEITGSASRMEALPSWRYRLSSSSPEFRIDQWRVVS